MSSAAACNTTHGKSALSFFSSTVSVLLLLSTSTLNLLVILVFIRNKKLLQKSVFYKMLLNIAIADFLTAVISDTTSISFHTKEGLGQHISTGEIYLLHCGLFIINGASILTMSLLCVDRIVALLKPLKYRNGMKTWKCLLMLASTWILSGLLAIPYFSMGYIKFLGVFSYTTVSITCISLTVAMIVYKKHFSPKPSPPSTPKSPKREAPNGAGLEYYYKNVKRDDTEDKAKRHESNQSTDNITSHEKIQSPSKKKTRNLCSEQRVNKSFFMMLVVFLLTYLPSVVMTAYMNLCTDCDCMFIHALRDLTYLAILSSALWRPLNFVIRLRTLRKEIKTLLGIQNVTGSSDSSRDGSSVNQNQHVRSRGTTRL